MSGPCPGGAWASLPRDTLHVVLTKPGQAGLELSKEACAELEGAEAAAAKFSHSASGEPLVNADPQATATAVLAQLMACMPELQDAGASRLSCRNLSGLGVLQHKVPETCMNFQQYLSYCVISHRAAHK